MVFIYLASNVKALKSKLIDRISNMYDSLIEIRKTLLTQNNEVKMNGIIEKIEKCQEEIKTIREKVKRVKNKTEIGEVSKELNQIEKNIQKRYRNSI